MNENRPCKKELLEWINIVSFAVDDVKLFLDTHPNCTEALDFFDEFKKQRVQALKEYAKYYGPLTLIRQLHKWIIGNGLMIRGHGRKGDANLCGIMRNDYNILLRLLRLTRKLPRLSLLNSVDQMENSLHL